MLSLKRNKNDQVHETNENFVCGCIASFSLMAFLNEAISSANEESSQEKIHYDENRGRG